MAMDQRSSAMDILDHFISLCPDIGLGLGLAPNRKWSPSGEASVSSVNSIKNDILNRTTSIYSRLLKIF